MKKLINILALTAALFTGAASAFGATVAPVNVQMTGDGTQLLLQNFHVPTGKTVTVDSGGALVIAAGGTFSPSAGSIAWTAVSKSGSSLLDLATRSAGDLSSGTLPVARLYTTAVGYNITGGAALDAIANLTPAASQFLQRNAGNTAYQYATISPVLTLGGDLTGNTTLTNLTSQTLTSVVAKVNGVTYGASPSTNTVPVVTGANTVTYQAVPNAALANSSITIGGVATSLGGTATSTAILDNIGSTRGSVLFRGAAAWSPLVPGTSTFVLTSNGAGADPTYQAVSATGITGILAGANGGTGVNNTGKTITLGGNLTTSGAFAATFTLGATTTVTLPATGTLVGSADTGTVTNTMLAGAIANAKLANSSVTIGSTSVSLGGTAATIAGLTLTTPKMTFTTIDLGSGALPAAYTTSTALQMSNVDTLAGGIEGVGYANTGLAMVGRGIGGTRGTPSATTLGQSLISFTGTGYDTAYVLTNAAVFKMVAQTAWTIGSHETAFQWNGTPNGSVTIVPWMTLDGAAGLKIATLGINGTPLGNSTASTAAVTSLSINAGITATGSTAYNFSGSSAAFQTSTGANTLNGAVSINDATTPSLTTAPGKTNTGFVQVSGKTSGGIKITAFDGGQLLTISTLSQTTGPATLSFPNMAGVNDTIVVANLTQSLNNKTLAANMVVSNAMTWTAGVRQTFGPNATTPGFNPGSNAGDPSTPINGDIWYDSTGNLMRARVNGATLTIGSAGGTVTHTVGALTAGQVVLGNGAADIATSAALSFAGTVASFTDTTDASNTTTAALKSAGGLAIVKKFFAGDAITVLANATNPTVGGGVNFHNVPADGVVPQFLGDASGTTGASYTGRTVGGTLASPTATPAGQTLVQVAGQGYANGAYTGTSGYMAFKAGALWSVSDTSSTFVMGLTPVGSTTRADILSITNSIFQYTAAAGSMVVSSTAGRPVNIVRSSGTAGSNTDTPGFGLNRATNALPSGATVGEIRFDGLNTGSTYTLYGEILTTTTGAATATGSPSRMDFIVGDGAGGTPSVMQLGPVSALINVRASIGTASPDATTELYVGGSVTAAAAFGQLERLSGTVTAAANSDNLVGSMAVPTFATGTFNPLYVIDYWARTATKTGTGTIAIAYGFLADAQVASTASVGMATNHQTAGTSVNIDFLLGTNGVPVSGNYGIYQGDTYGNVLGGATLIDQNVAGSALPAVLVAGAVPLRLAGPDATNTNVESIAYGTVASSFGLLGRSIGGTRASPSATVSGASFLRMNAYGYDTGYITTANASYNIAAGSLWTTGNHETQHVWLGTPSGSITNTTWMTLKGTGLKMSVPTADVMTTVTYAAPTVIDPTLGNSFTVTTVNATGSVTFNASSAGVAGQDVYIIIVNDATSGKTITWGTNFKPQAATLVGITSKTSTIHFKSDGASLWEISRITGLL